MWATGETSKQKTLSKIHHYAPKPNVAARTLYHGHIVFLGAKKGGSRGLIQTKLGTLFSTHALPPLAKFDRISFSRTGENSH